MSKLRTPSASKPSSEDARAGTEVPSDASAPPGISSEEIDRHMSENADGIRQLCRDIVEAYLS